MGTIFSSISWFHPKLVTRGTVVEQNLHHVQPTKKSCKTAYALVRCSHRFCHYLNYLKARMSFTVGIYCNTLQFSLFSSFISL